MSVGALVPWGFVGPQFGIWYVIVFAMLYLAAAPAIACAGQAIVLHEIPLEDHGMASALMNVMYQFGSSLLLALVNVAMGSTKKTGNPEEQLLNQYHNGAWALLGLTAAGLVLFLVFYARRESSKGGMINKTADGDAATPQETKEEGKESGEV